MNTLSAAEAAGESTERKPIAVAWMVTYGGLTNIVFKEPTEVVDTHYQTLYQTQGKEQWINTKTLKK